MESSTNQFARLQLMADGHDEWDLSDNDCAAIKMALSEIADLKRQLAEARDHVRTQCKRCLCAIDFLTMRGASSIGDCGQDRVRDWNSAIAAAKGAIDAAKELR